MENIDKILQRDSTINEIKQLLLNFDERNIISDIVKGNMETTKKSGLPFF